MIALGCSCTSENEIISESDMNRAKNIYNTFKSRKKVSLFSMAQGETRSESSFSSCIPFISAEDLKMLNSLDHSEMISLREHYLNKIGKSGIEASDKIEVENYEYVFNLLGGYDGMERLFVFFNNYLGEEEDENNLLKLLPNNLSDEAMYVYIGMGLFVDNIARPVYSLLSESDYSYVEENDIITRSDRIDCKLALGANLALLGVGVTVDGFLTAATGGALTELEIDSAVLGLTKVWLDYEACNGRWH